MGTIPQLIFDDLYVPIRVLVEVFNTEIEWNPSLQAIQISKANKDINGDSTISNGNVPINVTSIQIGNYLLDGFMMEESAYGVFHEVMETIGANVYSGCTELYIEYHGNDYMIDLITGSVHTANGDHLELEAKPIFLNSELIVPLDFLTEVFGIKIKFLEDHNTVLILQYYE